MTHESVATLPTLIKTEWAKLLLVDYAGDGDNFFVLGGDSMLGTTLMLSLMETTGVELSLGDLYENPTLQALTALIVSRMKQETRPAT